MKNTTKDVVARNLQHQLKIAGMQQNELAEIIGVSPAAVNMWLQAKTAPRADMVDKICKALNISRADLILDKDPKDELPSKALPIYNTIYADKSFFDDSNIERFVAVDVSVNADFGILISSPSMSGVGIDVGDVAFLTKKFKFKEGKIYAVYVLGAEAIALKKVYIRDNKYLLISEHQDFLPMVIENSEAFIVGELVGLYKNWANEEV